MKNLIIAPLLLLLCNLVFSQSVNFPIDKKTGEITYKGVVEVPNTSKNDLYLKANSWFVSSFNSAQDVIQYNSQDDGKIMAKGNIPVTYTALGMTKDMGYVSFVLQLDVKDGKYRYILNNLMHHGGSSGINSSGDLLLKKSKGLTKKAWNQIKEQTHDKCILLIDDLKKVMLSAQDEDDW